MLKLNDAAKSDDMMKNHMQILKKCSGRFLL